MKKFGVLFGMIGAALASSTMSNRKEIEKSVELDDEGKELIADAVEEIRPTNYNRNGRSRLDHRNVTTYQPKPPVPKGCKEYYFNADGTFRHNLLDKPYHWYCVASSDKIAINKFNKNNPQQIIGEPKDKLL